MKIAFPIAAILFLLASCGGPEPDVQLPSGRPDNVVERQVPEWVGLYADTMPCADCPGILTQLDLRKDSTYVLRERYLERDSVPFGRIGKWSVSDSVLLLNGRPEWSMEKDLLVKLGVDGKTLDSGIPHSIQPVANIGSSPMHLTGAYVYYTDSHSFTPCGSAYPIPVAMDVGKKGSAGLALEKLYGKQVTSPPDPLYVSIIVTMRTGPAMEGEGTEEYAHVEHVDSVLEKQACP